MIRAECYKPFTCSLSARCLDTKEEKFEIMQSSDNAFSVRSIDSR